MDLSVITAGFSGLKSALDIAKSLSATHTAVEVQGKAIELIEKIIQAQQLILEMQATSAQDRERQRELETQLASMKDWEIRKRRYRLAAPFPSCMVYALQKSLSDGELAHYLCASCYERGEASILQGREGCHTTKGTTRAAYYCPKSTCRAEAQTTFFNVEPPQYFEDITPRS